MQLTDYKASHELGRPLECHRLTEASHVVSVNGSSSSRSGGPLCSHPIQCRLMSCTAPPPHQPTASRVKYNARNKFRSSSLPFVAFGDLFILHYLSATATLFAKYFRLVNHTQMEG